jgi:hypothetical protein
MNRCGWSAMYVRKPMSIRTGLTLREEVKQLRGGFNGFFESRSAACFLENRARRGPITHWQ